MSNKSNYNLNTNINAEKHTSHIGCEAAPPEDSSSFRFLFLNVNPKPYLIDQQHLDYKTKKGHAQSKLHEQFIH